MAAVMTTGGETKARSGSPWRPDPRYVPLVVGVAGHRDLSHSAGGPGLEQLRQSVREAFEALRGKHRATPLVLLSSLADGADRLVAWIALELQICLVVPLPMPEPKYEATFRDDASIAEFRELCKHAARVFVVGDPSSADAEAGYEQVGAYIARNCHVLVALWDGARTEKRGGTAQVVRFLREGVPAHLDPGRSLLNSPATGPVCHINLPRTAQAVEPNAEPIRWLDPAGTPKRHGSGG